MKEKEKKYKYYIRPTSTLDPNNNAYKLIEREKLIIDSKYIEVIEAAENNFCTAWIELQEGFAYGGNGLPKNYKMARYYTDKMIDGCINDSKSLSLLFESYRASGYLEMDNGNSEVGKSELIKAVQIMVVHMPPNEWDYSITNTIYDLVSPYETPL